MPEVKASQGNRKYQRVKRKEANREERNNTGNKYVGIKNANEKLQHHK